MEPVVIIASRNVGAERAYMAPAIRRLGIVHGVTPDSAEFGSAAMVQSDSPPLPGQLECPANSPMGSAQWAHQNGHDW